MKRAASKRRDDREDSQRQRCVKWDEANLEENTKTQKEVNPGKINEPKTPYHGPMDSEDEDLGECLSPLSLEDQAAVEHLSDERNFRDSTTRWRDEGSRSTNGGHSDSDRGEHSSVARSDSGGSTYRSTYSYSSSGRVSTDNNTEEDSMTSANEEDKHRKFVARRKRHYNMRDALKRGKQLLQHDGGPQSAIQYSSIATNSSIGHPENSSPNHLSLSKTNLDQHNLEDQLSDAKL